MNLRIFLISLLSLVVIVGTLIGWSSYHYYEAIHSDDPITPTLNVEEGSASVIRSETAYDMRKGEKFDLVAGDAIETKRSSRAVVTWPDRSITRIGENSRIMIEKMYASNDYQKIEIAYDMKRGKVWNTIIRTLIGDSYFEARLPKNNIVAGVRGTTFEVNLDSGYIHAVDHATILTDITNKTIELLPGELVDSENIWVKKGREWLDTGWNEWNILSDKTYGQIRSLEIEKRLSSFMKEGILAKITTPLLSHISGFEDLEITKILRSGNPKELGKYSSDVLISFLGKIPDVTRAEEREKLRSVILTKDIDANIRDSIVLHSVWDSLDTGKLYGTAEDYLKKKGVPLPDISAIFGAGLKNNTKGLLETLSGSLSDILRRALP